VEAALAAAAAWLDAAGLKACAGGGAHPYINTVHLLGLVMLVGAIGVVDLRVAGLWRQLPTRPLSRALTPVAVAGLLVLLPSGLLLFAADGAALARSGAFQVKLILIGLALLNALFFRWRWGGDIDRPPPGARLAALASLALWLAAGTAGRFIAYAA
jgi:lysylphosphatidylglycerol synthetase-like protein (DUF2156 family)